MSIALAALVTSLALASLVVSVYALISAHKMFHAAKIITEANRAECAAVVESARLHCNAVSVEMQSVKSLPPPEIVPSVPKPGMNLTRRSNALRMHRTGNSPEQIAASLEVPRQEVDLLLKIHEIVLNNL